MMKSNENIPKVELYCKSVLYKGETKGAYAIILKYNEKEKSFCEVYEQSTRNRLELIGIIEGFKKLKKKVNITIYTSLTYIIDPFQKGWIENWVKNHWISNKREVANQDLWKELLEVMEPHNAEFVYCDDKNLEQCFHLANEFLKNSKEVKVDEGRKIENLKQEKSLKIRKEGDLCRKCQTPVIKKVKENKKIKEHQTYYYEYIFQCPNCRAIYMVEEAKVYL